MYTLTWHNKIHVRLNFFLCNVEKPLTFLFIYLHLPYGPYWTCLSPCIKLNQVWCFCTDSGDTTQLTIIHVVSSRPNWPTFLIGKIRNNWIVFVIMNTKLLSCVKVHCILSLACKVSDSPDKYTLYTIIRCVTISVRGTSPANLDELMIMSVPRGL